MLQEMLKQLSQRSGVYCAGSFHEAHRHTRGIPVLGHAPRRRAGRAHLCDTARKASRGRPRRRRSGRARRSQDVGSGIRLCVEWLEGGAAAPPSPPREGLTGVLRPEADHWPPAGTSAASWHPCALGELVDGGGNLRLRAIGLARCRQEGSLLTVSPCENPEESVHGWLSARPGDELPPSETERHDQWH